MQNEDEVKKEMEKARAEREQETGKDVGNIVDYLKISAGESQRISGKIETIAERTGNFTDTLEIIKHDFYLGAEFYAGFVIGRMVEMNHQSHELEAMFREMVEE